MTKVRCVETGIVYNSCKEAEIVLSLPKGSVSRAANPKQPQQLSGGFHWAYEEKTVVYTSSSSNGKYYSELHITNIDNPSKI